MQRKMRTCKGSVNDAYTHIYIYIYIYACGVQNVKITTLTMTILGENNYSTREVICTGPGQRKSRKGRAVPGQFTAGNYGNCMTANST